MKMHLDTRVLHDGYAPDRETGATVPAIAQSTAYAYDAAADLENVFAGRSPGYIYARIGNPSVGAFERRIAALEDGIGAVAFASGMAAISALVLGLAGAGDEIVSGNSLFGGTWSLFRETLGRYGIRTRFVDARHPDAVRRAVTNRTRLIFVESIGNPKMDVPDLSAIADVARRKGVPLAVDNTVTTPMLLRPGEMGADLTVHSASKFINGHGNAVGGVIVDSGRFDWSSPRYAHLKAWHVRTGEHAFLAYLRHAIRRDLGGCLSPLNAFLLSMGLDSLAVRMERHCANAVRVARFLEGHPAVREVRYPGLEDHPDHSVALRQFGGRYGAILTVRLRDRAACFDFIDRLNLALNLANLGDTRTLVIHPASTFCRDLSEEDRRAVGVSEDRLRISVGLEQADDIVQDMQEALAAVKGKDKV